MRSIERTNVAVKCTYCNGGAESGQTIGFDGICSDNIIKYNINKPRVWCSNVNSPCKKYVSHQISRIELENQLKSNGKVCYESVMMRDWKAYAGYYRSGVNKGKPMSLSKAQANSLVIFTTRMPNTLESERLIFAVSLIDESYKGDASIEGYVTTNPRWRIALTPQEADKMLFWKYYVNSRSPNRIRWDSKLFRYMTDEQAVQILQDIVAVKTLQDEKCYAQEFLVHYCTIHDIDKNNVTSPNGSLLRNII